MNVLVLVVRGWHLGYLGCYGNPWIETPALDALAAESVVFDQHYADALDAGEVRRVWQSGRYRLPSPGASLPEAGSNLIAHLGEHGVCTHLVEDARKPSAWASVDGWDGVHQARASEDATSFEATLEAIVAAVEELGGQDRPWLVWGEFASLQPPWDVPSGFLERYFRQMTSEEEEEVEEEEENEKQERLDEDQDPLVPLTDLPGPGIDPDDDRLFLQVRNSYAGCVTYLDAGLDQLFETLREMACLDDTAVIVTSDRGQALGEHGVLGEAGSWVHEEVVHIPLLIRLPGIEGRRVMGLTQHVDLAPTIAGLFGKPLPDVHGHDLIPLMLGEAEQVRPYACAGRETDGSATWLLRSPEMALLVSTQVDGEGIPLEPQLFVKPADRWEVNDVFAQHVDRADGLRQTLQTFLEATRRPGPLLAPPLPGEEEEGVQA